jgi:hypothetical protein
MISFFKTLFQKKHNKKKRTIVCSGCCHLYKNKMCLRQVEFVHDAVHKNISIKNYQAALKANKNLNCKFKSFAFWKTFYLQLWCRKNIKE